MRNLRFQNFTGYLKFKPEIGTKIVMTAQITIIVHGPAEAPSLAACIDSLLAQKKISWVKEVLVLAPQQNRTNHLSLSARQKRSGDWIRILVGDINMAMQVATTPWVAFLANDGIAPHDWIEKQWLQFQKAQQINPLVVGIGAPLGYVDVGGISQSLHILTGSAICHLDDPRWWQPTVETQVPFVGLENSLFQRTTLARVGWLNLNSKFVSPEMELGLRLKDEGSLLMLFPQPVVMRRELNKPSLWFQRWYQTGKAQEQFDSELNVGWSGLSFLAWGLGMTLILSIFALPFTNWLASALLVYALIVLNACASLAFKVNEPLRTLTLAGLAMSTHFTFVFGFWSNRIKRFGRILLASRIGSLITKNIYLPSQKALGEIYTSSESLLNESLAPTPQTPKLTPPSQTRPSPINPVSNESRPEL